MKVGKKYYIEQGVMLQGRSVEFYSSSRIQMMERYIDQLAAKFYIVERARQNRLISTQCIRALAVLQLCADYLFRNDIMRCLYSSCDVMFHALLAYFFVAVKANPNL